MGMQVPLEEPISKLLLRESLWVHNLACLDKLPSFLPQASRKFGSSVAGYECFRKRGKVVAPSCRGQSTAHDSKVVKISARAYLGSDRRKSIKLPPKVFLVWLLGKQCSNGGTLVRVTLVWYQT